jgi:polysaccharide pyruvyl transferase WcaK-like protein
MAIAKQGHGTMVRHIHILDTSVATDNVGDEIIADASRRIVARLFPDALLSTSASHDGLGPFGRSLVAEADVALLIGTNALTALDQRRFRFIWTIAREDIAVLRNKVVLFGVGANRDFDQINWRQKRLLDAVLSKDHTHSVRDEQGRRLVEMIGRKVVNTSCPTLWAYAQTPPQVPETKADRVIFTLTKHKPDPADAALVRILRDRYATVAFWPQQLRDLGYLREITPSLEGIEIVAPNLAAYDRFLAAAPVDVIGTRLHGTIRGLLHGRRCLAITIDNRARDIGAETGLPVLDRARVPEDLAGLIDQPRTLNLLLPQNRIAEFQAQFAL